MIRSAITVSLVEEARGGPFVFWHDLAGACAKAAALGFDAVEVFPADAADLKARGLAGLLDKHSLKLAAVGTGAGWVKHKLTLSDPATQRRAVDFARRVIDAAADHGAPAIVGSMQGRDPTGRKFGPAFDLLCDSVAELAAHAAARGQALLVEPLNRYESNVLNTLADGVELIRRVGSPAAKLLADLFHMNIEEVSLAGSLRDAAGHVGHVHLADSNRLAAGWGHADFAPAVAELLRQNYAGYLSAEVLSKPNPDAAAAQAIEGYRSLLVPATPA